MHRLDIAVAGMEGEEMTTTLQPSAFALRSLVMYHTHTRPEDWETNSRSKSLVKGRWVMALIARDKLGLSLPEIARLCGWASHTTARKAIWYARKDAECVALADSIYARAKQGQE